MATAMSPTAAACQAWVSDSLPSVAETSVRSICLKLTGSAPVWRISARFFASDCDPVVICAPPAIPFCSWASV